MRWREWSLDVQDAWLDVCSRPFRSALSAIGICVGVLALVAMMSITGGAREEALAGAQSLGLDKIRVERLTSTEFTRSGGLTVRDADTLNRESGVAVLATYFHRQADLVVQSALTQRQVTRLAVPPDFFAMEDLDVLYGAPWLAGTEAGTCCIAGSELARDLGLQLGQSMLVNGQACTVAGILAAHAPLVTEGTGLSAIDFDRSIFVPFMSWAGRDSGAPVSGLIVKVSPDQEFHEAVTAITTALRQAHFGEQEFLVVVPRALAAQVDETQQLFTLIMSAIAGLALLVGGIGIANSLLATVAEQTREIGLRMAVGASARRVLTLYVLQAIWICAIGAVAGAVAGLLVAVTVQVMAEWQVHLSVLSVPVGVVFALITGMISASYPALRASRMSAAEALVDR